MKTHEKIRLQLDELKKRNIREMADLAGVGHTTLWRLLNKHGETHYGIIIKLENVGLINYDFLNEVSSENETPEIN